MLRDLLAWWRVVCLVLLVLVSQRKHRTPATPSVLPDNSIFQFSLKETTTLNEADENNLRVLLARLRTEDPAVLLGMLCDVALSPLEDSTIFAVRRSDDDNVPNAMLVFFKGYDVTSWAEKSLSEMQRLADTAEKESAGPEILDFPPRRTKATDLLKNSDPEPLPEPFVEDGESEEDQ